MIRVHMYEIYVLTISSGGLGADKLKFKAHYIP